MELGDIQHLLEKINGCTFASMDTTTKVALTGGKANPMKDKVFKVAKGHRIILFCNKHSNGYENMVNRRRATEGHELEFEVAARKWGERVPNLPVIVNGDKFYLDTIFTKSGKVHYEYEGKVIDEEAIIGFPKPKTDSGRQELSNDNKVIVRSFKMESIDIIRLMGEVIDVDNLEHEKFLELINANRDIEA